MTDRPITKVGTQWRVGNLWLFWRHPEFGDVMEPEEGDDESFVHALYDAHQTQERECWETGDTFSLKGRIIAIVDGVHVVPA